MKILALLAFAPLLSYAMISPEAIELARLEQEAAALRHTLGGCSVSEEGQIIPGRSIVEKKDDKRAMVLLNTVDADLMNLREKCRNSRAASRLLAIQKYSASLKNRLGIQGTLPSSVSEAFQDSKDEVALEIASELTMRSMDRGVCPREDQPTDQLSWHAFLLQNGYLCTVKTYKLMSTEFNMRNGQTWAQNDFNELGKLNLAQLKNLFKKEFAAELKNKTMNIAFIPQLSYENGMMTSIYPYRWFLKETERTSYNFLESEFNKLGAGVKIIYRNSLANLDEQVRVTEEGLANLKGPHLVISRSMGSRVMNEVRKRSEMGLTSVTHNVATWYNVGGTPNGSVIADYKSRPDLFYRGLWPTVSETFNFPVELIAKDPRVVNHLPSTIYAALDRSNLPTLAHHESLNPQGSAHGDMKVYNLIFLAPTYERATQGVDPVYTHMLSYGPTEGSAPLAGAAVDTAHSARVFYDLDHLAFWKLSPQEGLAVYLRTLIAGKRSKLSF